jgi:hypothetical protein
MARPRGHPKSGGRKKGTPNKATVARQAMAAGAFAAGKTPLEVMLANMGFAHDSAAALQRKLADDDVPEGDLLREVMRLREVSQSCARDAAPYIHPRLSPVQPHDDAEKPPTSIVRVEFVRARDGRPDLELHDGRQLELPPVKQATKTPSLPRPYGR